MPLDHVTTRGPILVTGGLGFVGGHLVDGLVAAGIADIRVFDNYRRAVTNARDWPVNAVTLIRGDIRDRTELQKAMQGCKVVYHLAAQSNVLGADSDPDYSFAANVGGTLNVLVAAKNAAVRRVVFTSSREVYGDQDQIPIPESAPLRPKNLYGASKAAGEMYCRALGDRDLEVVVTRLANVYGPRDRDRVIPIFLECALNGAPLTVYGGDQVIDFVWIDTVIEALLATGFGAYVPEPLNIGSGVGITVLELARRILAMVPSNSQCVRMPVRNVEVSRFVADISRGTSILGISSPDDPLLQLPQLVDRARKETILIG